MELITDRTAQDVARWRELHDKGWAAMTAEEQAEWMTAMKGCYGYTDMNRVEAAVKLLAERISELGYLYQPEVKTNWTRQEIPTRDEMNRYFKNVAEFKRRFVVYPETPASPSVGNSLDYSMANDLEKILLDVEELINNMIQSRYYSGELYAGEV